MVTAVASPDDDGEQPSRFLAELGVTVEEVAGPARAGRCRWRAGRRAAPYVGRPRVTRSRCDAAAARRLARLAASAGPGARPDGRPVDWWGTRAASRSVTPMRDPDAPGAGLGQPPRRSFDAARRSGSWTARPAASRGPTSRPTSGLSCTPSPSASPAASSTAGPDDAVRLMDHVDGGLGPAGVPHPVGAGPRARPGPGGLGRFLALAPRNPRTVLGTEEPFHAVVDLPDGEQVG